MDSIDLRKLPLYQPIKRALLDFFYAVDEGISYDKEIAVVLFLTSSAQAPAQTQLMGWVVINLDFSSSRSADKPAERNSTYKPYQSLSVLVEFKARLWQSCSKTLFLFHIAWQVLPSLQTLSNWRFFWQSSSSNASSSTTLFILEERWNWRNVFN